MWRRGDEDGLQSQRSEVQIQVSAELKQPGGLGIGLEPVVSVLFFLKNTPSPSPPPPKKKVEKSLS